jgi:hypothetical protein
VVSPSVAIKHVIAREKDSIEVLVYARLCRGVARAETVMRRLDDGHWYPMSDDALAEYGVSVGVLGRKLLPAVRKMVLEDR